MPISPQPVAKAADLKEEPFGIFRRDAVADHLVMEMHSRIRFASTE